MISSDKNSVQLIVEQCLLNGMKTVVCSPGSRNAPLLIAFDEHPEIKTLVIHDERCAAFYALGLSQQLNAPVGVVCTSGSAALNYYPAIAEAYYQCVPLVILTADRPMEWINQGDGQTIVQNEVFKNHVRYSCQFNEQYTHVDQKWYIEREIAIAFNEGAKYWKGPIHFNICLNEPLYQTSAIKPNKIRNIQLIQGNFKLSSAQKLECAEALKLPKKLVICGQMTKDESVLLALKTFATDPSVVVLIENTSNLVDKRFFSCIDRTLATISEQELSSFAPDLLITLGGAVVSKRIKAFLRKHKPKEHWKVGLEFPYMDTYQCLTHSFQASAAEFLNELNTLGITNQDSTYFQNWKSKNDWSLLQMESFFTNKTFSDLEVFETVLKHIPNQTHLHLGNSSVVRYTQLFDAQKELTYYSNRGTSGIDGSCSTACGSALADSNQNHLLIIGDVSFFYDSNAFWTHLPLNNLRVIVINNSGGGIFKIIPGPSKTNQLERFFEAKHSFNAQDLCKTFNLKYIAVQSIHDIEKQIDAFLNFKTSEGSQLMEIFTPSDFNHKRLEEFFEMMKLVPTK